MAKRIKWDEAATAAQNARRKLPALVKEYFTEGRAVARGKPSPAAIHRFMLRTRRLDYSLELFQSDIAPVLRREIPDPPWGWGGGPISDDAVPARAVAATG